MQLLPPPVQRTVDVLVGMDGGLRSVLFFGSRLVGTTPNPHSATDLILVVDEYKPFYEALRDALKLRRGANALARLNSWLPPNILSLRMEDTLGAESKCIVMSAADMQRALSADAPDHFCKGRLAQRVAVVYARTTDEGNELVAWLDAARHHTVEWMPCFLPEEFTAADYCQRMLQVSYSAEIRPESTDRVREVFEAQREALLELYSPVLEAAVAKGILTGPIAAEGEARRYSCVTPPSASVRRKWKNYFRRSKTRATIRWSKYMFTYDDWLEYIARKAERRTGVPLELTPAERKLPFLLLWPKVIRVLRSRNRPPLPPANGTTHEN